MPWMTRTARVLAWIVSRLTALYRRLGTLRVSGQSVVQPQGKEEEEDEDGEEGRRRWNVEVRRK